MTRREKTLKIIRREIDGFIPFEFSLCPSLNDKFRELTGATKCNDYFDMPYYFIYVPAKKRDIDFSKYFDRPLKPGHYFNEFGVAFEPGNTASSEHFSHMIPPMKNFEEQEEFEAYPYPDPIEDYDWDYINREVERLHNEDRVAVGGLAMTIFEIGWYMRGMEEFLVDMAMGEEFLDYHLDRITEIRCRQAEMYAKAGVDVLHVGDDIATQLNMMFSLEQYRTYIKPRLKKVIDAARAVNPDIIIDYHSDGNCEQAIPDLIEIGVQVLNPVQPECMDPAALKEKFGDKLSFRGTIGTQSTMPFGTPDDVRAEVNRMIETVGKGGGLILAPSHILEPEVPWENVLAFVDAIKAFNDKNA